MSVSADERMRVLKEAGERYNLFGHGVDPTVLEAETDGPLSGMTVGLKANISVKGQPHTAGLAHRADHIAHTNAAVTDLLIASGADLVPGLNMDEAALGGMGDNAHFGRTDNSRAPGHSAGGSSSGSAVALASGCVDLALGTDTLGSIRIPASWCGVVGLKPTRGLISRSGITTLAAGFDSVGPMACRAADLPALLDALAGFDVDDPDSLAMPENASENDHTRPMRIVVPTSIGSVDCEPETRRALALARDALAVLGHDMVEREVFGWSPQQLARCAFLMLEAQAAVAFAEDLERDDTFSPATWKMMLFGRDMAASKLAAAAIEIDRARAGFRHALQHADMVLMPTTPQRAVRADAGAPPDQAVFTAPASVTGLPAIAVPVEFEGEERPASVQLMGRAWSDRALVACAIALQERL